MRLNSNDDHKDMQMAWRKPKITEISVGMEINCYACAEISE